MTCNSFASSAVFALGAATAWLPWAMATAPWLGLASARSLYLVAAVAIYVATLAPTRCRAIGVGGVAAFAGSVAAVMAANVHELLWALGAIIALGRSVFWSCSTPRAIAGDILLLVGAVSLARWLGAAGIFATGLSLWAFFLVQSCFFLGRGRPPRPVAETGLDPFEVARCRAEALLSSPGPAAGRF